MVKKKFFFRSIHTKLTFLLMVASIFPILIIGILSINIARDSMEDMVFSNLESIGTHHQQEITTFLTRKKRDIEILAKQKETKDAFEKLNNFHNAGGATPMGPYDTESEVYNTIYSEIDPFFKNFLEAYDFYDVFFICSEHGHVMYTSLREDDLGTNLSSGKYRESKLAELWSAIVSSKKSVMTDFAYYAASNENASFIGAPVFDENGYLTAVVALQLSTKKINEIMQEVTGLGETGEAYLVGKDYLMRSNSRFSDKSDILSQKVNTPSVELGLQEKSGTHSIESFRGIPVLSYYDNLGLNEMFETDFDWVIVAEINESEAFSKISLLRNEIFLIGLVLIVLIAILARFAAKKFSKPIIQLEQTANYIIKGDLTHEIEIETDDEIGKLAGTFRLMQKKLRKQLKELSEGVNVLSSSSSQIMSMVSQLASGSAETATSVSETTSTVEEVKQTAEISNQKSVEVSDMAQNISEVSQDGLKSTRQTIEGMKKIKEQMDKIAGIIMHLSEKSTKIGDIANNVSDLAEQSNLLAVNASIEAAKAGESGKGFSVVAQEIKNLANRSKESTVKIRSIVSDIQREISSAVMATEQGNKVIHAGLELSSKANEVISTLASGVEEASQANIQIAASSQQQVVGMDQVTSAMENIKEASTQGTEGARQTEESVKELKKLGEKLLQIINQYNL